MKSTIYPALLAVSATLVFVASASATSVTTTTGGAAATPAIHAVNEGGHVKLANSIANIECGSTLEGTVESHGAGVAAKGNIAKLEWPGCTNSWHVTTEKAGSLSIAWTSGHNGTVTSNGALVKTTRFFVPCNYETSNTKIGTLTGGNPATLTLEASIPIASGSSELCGSGNAKWEGSYVTTSALYAAPEGGGEGGGQVDIEPSSKKMKFTEWQNFRIKNTGPGSATINNLTVSITKGNSFAFEVEDPNGCKGKTLSSGGTCEVRITCWEWEAHGKLTVDTSAGNVTAMLNSTP